MINSTAPFTDEQIDWLEDAYIEQSAHWECMAEMDRSRGNRRLAEMDLLCVLDALKTTASIKKLRRSAIGRAQLQRTFIEPKI